VRDFSLHFRPFVGYPGAYNKMEKGLREAMLVAVVLVLCTYNYIAVLCYSHFNDV